MNSSIVICAGATGVGAAGAGVCVAAGVAVGCGGIGASVTGLPPCDTDSFASCPVNAYALILGDNASPFWILVPGGRRCHCLSSNGMGFEKKSEFNPN